MKKMDIVLEKLKKRLIVIKFLNLYMLNEKLRILKKINC